MVTEIKAVLSITGLLALAMTTALMIAACSQEKSAPSSKIVTREYRPETYVAQKDSIRHDQPELSDVNKEQFRLIMDSFGALDLDRMSLEMSAGLPARSSDIPLMAAVLAGSARTIQQIYPNAQTSDENKLRIEQFASNLRIRSLELGECAREKDFINTTARLNEVIATCNACHLSFRRPMRADGAIRM